MVEHDSQLGHLAQGQRQQRQLVGRAVEPQHHPQLGQCPQQRQPLEVTGAPGIGPAKSAEPQADEAELAVPAPRRRNGVWVGVVEHADTAEAVGIAVEHHRQVLVVMVQRNDHRAVDALAIHKVDERLRRRAELGRVERMHAARVLGRLSLEQVQMGVDDHRLICESAARCCRTSRDRGRPRRRGSSASAPRPPRTPRRRARPSR